MGTNVNVLPREQMAQQSARDKRYQRFSHNHAGDAPIGTDEVRGPKARCLVRTASANPRAVKCLWAQIASRKE